MAVYRFETVLDEDHVIKLPPEIPSGAVEVQVTTKESGYSNHAAFMAMLERLHSEPPRNRSKEDIDRYIREERDSWED